MENIRDKESVVSTDVAIQEMKKFLYEHTFEDKAGKDIEEDYPQLIMAIERGLLVFDQDQEMKPTFSLLNPVGDSDGNPVLENIAFKTRMKASDSARLMKGLEVAKNQGEYANRCYSYFAGLDRKSKAYLDKLCKFDQKVVEQISAVFL